LSFQLVNKTLAEVQQSLAAYLPGGILWEAALVPGTNLNAVLAGQSGILLDTEVFNQIYNSEWMPTSEGTNFLEDWEQAISIPDDCFPGPDEPDREIRRLHVIVKLASLGIQTSDEFENLATLLGFPGTEVVAGVGSEFESIINGAFDTDTDWTKGTGWTISGGTANKAAGVGSDLSQDIASDSGKLYVLNYDVSGRTAGTITPDIGGQDGVVRSNNGSFQENITALAVDTLFRLEADSAFDGSIDNVSVRGSLPLPDAVFTIVIKYKITTNKFPIKFPIIFGSDQFNILTCLFNKLKPANTKVIAQVGG